MSLTEILINEDLVKLSIAPVTGEFPSQMPVTQSSHIFCDLCLNKRFSKQSIRGWYETPSRPLWRHCNVSRHLWFFLPGLYVPQFPDATVTAHDNRTTVSVRAVTWVAMGNQGTMNCPYIAVQYYTQIQLGSTNNRELIKFWKDIRHLFWCLVLRNTRYNLQVEYVNRGGGGGGRTATRSTEPAEHWQPAPGWRRTGAGMRRVVGGAYS